MSSVFFGVVAVVLDDFLDIELSARASAVLSKVHLDLGCLYGDTFVYNTVGCSEDMGGGDQGSSAPFALF